MRLKLYRAASVKEAMALVRAELGPEALILSERRVAQGVELTAALEPGDEPPASETPRPTADFAYHGVAPALSARLAGPDLQAALASLLRFGRLGLEPGSRLLLAGLPGAGKTLTIARLATRLVLAGIRPLVITADGRRAGAAEELGAYTRLLGVDLIVAGSPAMLERALATPAAQGSAPVLIDTPGINPFDPAELAGLGELLEAGRACPVLVMAAGQDSFEACEQASCFTRLGVSHVLPTRLDMARRLGSVINTAAAAKLTLTEASIGPAITGTLVEATPAFLAARLLPVAATLPVSPAAPAALRRPVFPSARSREALAWSTESHG